jgi:diguanylate cyclase (GGDEF)-like protein
MLTENSSGAQRILIIGAGRGGSAMIDIFIDDPMIEMVGIVDTNPAAPAMEIANKNGIPRFTNLDVAITACSPCLVLNLSANEGVTTYVASKLGSNNVIGGFQGRFIWKLMTRLKNTNEQVLYLAHHDGLTGLPNRILFYDRLNQAIARARREKELVGILFLDLDGFKHINDTLGHDAGDLLLQQVAGRIKACVRGSDTVARLGGDEFTVALYNCGTHVNVSLAAQKIIDAIASPFLLNGKNCSISVSIGISCYPKHGELSDVLIKVADAAMYLAKQSGKNRFRTVE